MNPNMLGRTAIGMAVLLAFAGAALAQPVTTSTTRQIIDMQLQSRATTPPGAPMSGAEAARIEARMSGTRRSAPANPDASSPAYSNSSQAGR